MLSRLLVIADGEQVQQLACVHGAEGYIVLVDCGIGNIDLEALQAHDLVLQCVPHQQPVDCDCPLLTKPMGSVHGLQSPEPPAELTWIQASCSITYWAIWQALNES